MSIQTLPPELLHYIFSLSIPSPFASLSHAEYLVRKSSLYSLALVHPSWSRMAQEILFLEIWLHEGEEGMARKGRQIAKSRGKFKTRSLMVEGCLDTLFSSTKHKTWEDVKFLEYVNWDEPQTLTLYTEFPNLERLSLRAHHQIPLDGNGPLQPNLFRNLRRLEIHLDGDGWSCVNAYKPFFHPLNCPQLRHLALDVDGMSPRILKEILPQLEVLDIQNELCYIPSYTILEDSTPFRNLKHLAFHRVSDFDGPDEDENWTTHEMNNHEWLYSNEGQFDLDSFHLQFELVRPFTNRILPRLADIANGKVETFRAKRVVVYGVSKEKAGQYHPGVDCEKIEWGTNWSRRFEMLE
ncbi:hypothetical protein JCM3765_002328 [Sporobolomyces pararoseus]